MRNILVIDDEENIRTVVAASLRSEGFSVEECPNGEQALATLTRFQPDLIISDIMMEGMTGYDLLESVRKDPSTLNVPFIFITGVTGKETYRRGMDLGADDFLSKPFSKAELLASVRTRLHMKQLMNQESDRRMDELRQSISLALPHEFRTPLNAVLAFSKILAEDDQVSPEEVRKFGGMIRKAGQRLHRLVENYLALSQIDLAIADELKRIELRSHTMPHPDKVIRTAFREKSIEYARPHDLAVQSDAAECAISHEHLSKIIMEVADNAFKFSKPGDPITVWASSDGEKYEIHVMDRGVGFPEDQHRQIEAFQQFDRKNGEQQGAGLGLGIVKRLLTLYGGSFAIEPSEGKGTTIVITIPLAVQTA